ncbi:MAG: primosomal replication protein N [Burkholderiales bacterium]
MDQANRVELSGTLAQLGALRHTPAGIPLIELRIRHESQAAEAGSRRRVEAEVEAIAFQSHARLLAAAAPGSALRVEGFLCAKSRRSKKLVLHLTKIEFTEGV